MGQKAALTSIAVGNVVVVGSFLKKIFTKPSPNNVKTGIIEEFPGNGITDLHTSGPPANLNQTKEPQPIYPTNRPANTARPEEL